MRRSSLLLVNPGVSKLAPYRHVITLGPGYLAAVERGRREVRIVNQEYQGLSEKDIAIIALQYDVTGITAMSFQSRSALEIAGLIKKACPAKKVIAGGVAATGDSDFFLDSGCFDAVVRGEGENTLKTVMDRFDRNQELNDIPGVILPGSRPDTTPVVPLDMEEVPFPARDLMPGRGINPKDPVFEGRPSAVVMLSRGCPFSCIFCSSPGIWGHHIRRRSVEQAMRELASISKQFGITDFALEDDCFTASLEWTELFCENIRKSRHFRFRINTHADLVNTDILQILKDSGCVKITYGVESVDSQIRKLARKPLDLAHLEEMLEWHENAGLPAATLFIVGLPGETEETVQANISWLHRIKPNGGWDFQVAQPHPGSDFYNLGEGYGRFLSRNRDDYFSDNITFVPSPFTVERFAELCQQVCGRVIGVAGHSAVSSEKCDGDYQVISEIKPENWSEQAWDNFGGLWQGNDRCRSGLAFVKGDGAGYTGYRLVLHHLPEGWSGISVRLASHHYVWPTPPDGASLVECIVNGNVAGRRLVHSVHTTGMRICFAIPPDMWRSGENSLKFRVPPGLYANGLSIFTFPVHSFFKDIAQGVQVIAGL